jgi:hypothetical protein
VSCGQEDGRTGPAGPWMCRSLRPTSCPLLYPQTHLNWWLIPRGCKNVFEYQLYSGERVEERPLAHRGSAPRRREPPAAFLPDLPSAVGKNSASRRREALPRGPSLSFKGKGS